MEVRIEKLVYGGDGLAHHDGHTVFVPLVLPGELVRIESSARKKKFIRGRLEHVVEPSPERVPAPCPHFGRCGGCQYQHMPYEAQKRYKSEILRETLGRIGRIQWAGAIEMHASPAIRLSQSGAMEASNESGRLRGKRGDRVFRNGKHETLRRHRNARFFLRGWPKRFPVCAGWLCRGKTCPRSMKSKPLPIPKMKSCF